MKMTALTPSGYWQSRRNRFDMFVTFLGVIWIFMHFTLQGVGIIHVVNVFMSLTSFILTIINILNDY